MENSQPTEKQIAHATKSLRLRIKSLLPNKQLLGGFLSDPLALKSVEAGLVHLWMELQALRKTLANVESASRSWIRVADGVVAGYSVRTYSCATGTLISLPLLFVEAFLAGQTLDGYFLSHPHDPAWVIFKPHQGEEMIMPLSLVYHLTAIRDSTPPPPNPRSAVS